LHHNNLQVLVTKSIELLPEVFTKKLNWKTVSKRSGNYFYFWFPQTFIPHLKYGLFTWKYNFIAAKMRSSASIPLLLFCSTDLPRKFQTKQNNSQLYELPELSPMQDAGKI
jgi:hypothetical protein